MSKITEVDVIVSNAEYEVQAAHERLLYHARELAGRMSRLAARVEREGVEVSVSSLGEVQDYGTSVDRACAELGAARERLKLVKRAVAAART